MSTISVTNINDGDAVTAASVNNQINTIVNDYNGGITAANLASNAVTDAKITANNLLATKFSNLYKFNVYLTAAQNVGTAATMVLYNAKNFDTGSNVDIVTNKGRFTAPVAGFYQFNATIATTAAGAGTNIVIQLYKNGSAVYQGNNISATAGSNPGGVIATLLQVSANDYFEVFVLTGTAAKALDVTFNYNNTFSGFLVSSI